MTDNDVIKELEACVREAVVIINRQKAEIERLEKLNEIELDKLNAEKNDVMYYKDRIKAEAVKEFVNKIRTRLNCNTPRGAYLLNIVDNLVKETIGEKENV